jgi:hypothetical protein
LSVQASQSALTSIGTMLATAALAGTVSGTSTA